MPKVLPLKINSLFLDKPEQVIGQDIMFENIPWMNQSKEVFENPNTPFDANAIIPRPFSYDNALYLDKGVHLHFILPGFFKKFDDKGNLPKAPNRWYVRQGEQEWMIESDYIWDVNDPDLDKNTTCSYVEGALEGNFHFNYVGRKYSFAGWKKKPRISSDKYLDNLTALGWGSLAFDVHYANCRSVFGFYDPDTTIVPMPYTIVGWVDGDPDAPIVAGNFEIKADKQQEQTEEFNIAIANTPQEALTALILEDIDEGDETLVERLRKEEQIASILGFDSLNDQKLDWVSRLRHQQHENQFNVINGFSKWEIKASDLPIDSSIVINKIEDLFSKEIKDLNALQRQCDVAHQNLYSGLEHLHIDWSKYLSNVFLEKSPNNELTKCLEKIESKIELSKYEELHCAQLAKKINITTDDLTYQIRNNQSIEKIINQLIEKIEDLKTVANKYLKESNPDTDEPALRRKLYDLVLSKITIERKTGLNFYEALPPSVIISTSNKNSLINTFNDKEPLPELKIEGIGKEDDIATIINKITKNNALPAMEVSANSWKTYKVEWHAEFLPKKNGHYLNDPDENFSSDFLLDTYQLDEQNADLIKKYKLDNIAYNASGNNYYGHSFVDSTLKEFVLDRIAGTEETSKQEKGNNQSIYELLEKYKSKLDGIDLFEFTLSDFNNLMIQRSNALSVLPLMPNGFQNHKNTASELNALLGKHKGNINLLSTNNSSAFNPLRNGALSLNRLRIIDCFGREQKVHPKKIITTKNQTFADKPDWVILPPRILQPMALDVQLDYHTSKTKENPVIGWIIPVFLNQHLEFFDDKGKHIGALNEEGKWEPTPFNITSARENESAIDTIENPDLQNIVKWFKKQGEQPGFIANVIKEIQYNLEHIAPENYQNPSLMETMASIPIAITKIDYRLISKGKSVYNVKNKEIVFDDQAQENGLSRIKFPIRFGDENQYNDGLIGYWNKDSNPFNQKTLYINSETVSAISSNAQKSVEVYKEIKNIFHLNAAKINIKNSLDIGKRIKDILHENFHLPDILNMDLLNRLSDPVNVLNNINKSKFNVFNEFDIDNLVNPKMFFLLDRFTNLMNPNNSRGINLQLENGSSTSTQFEALIHLLESILENKGNISKPHVLKQFTEKGNLIWDTLQELDIIPSKTYPVAYAIASKAEDQEGFQTINGCGKSIIALLHPKANLFFKSGILPESTISLPYNEIKDALRRIELTLLTSPIVTPKENLQVSLLKDKRYKWSWVDLQKMKKEKLSTENKPLLNRIPQELALKALEQSDINTLIDKGLIDQEVFFPDEKLYYINTGKYQEFMNQKSMTKEDERLMELIESKKMSISDFNISDPTIPKLILKEGWVSIKSTQL